MTDAKTIIEAKFELELLKARRAYDAAVDRALERRRERLREIEISREDHPHD